MNKHDEIVWDEDTGQMIPNPNTPPITWRTLGQVAVISLTVVGFLYVFQAIEGYAR